MTYRLGIDLGTSNTVAVLAGPDGRAKNLLFDASPLLSSAVFGAATGELLTGQDAERAATAYPAGLEANPKRRIDDGTAWLGEREHAVVDLLAAVLGRVAAEARRVAGRTPETVVLTHPAAWATARLGLLSAAAARAGLGVVDLVAEPVAAAAWFAVAQQLPEGRCLAVYDLGAGTFDVSVVRRTAGGFEVVAADGLTDVGGLDLDAAVVDHARALTAGAAGAAEAWGRLDWPQTARDQQARRTLWLGARAAKEQLTRHTTADLHLPLLDAGLHLTRDEFERAARPYLERTTALTVDVLRRAGVAPERVAGVFLVGGSSRIPLASTLLHRTLRISPTVVDQPELVVAEGSILAAGLTSGPVAAPGAPVSGSPVSAAPVSGVPVSGAPVPVLSVPAPRAAAEAVSASSPAAPVSPGPFTVPAAAPVSPPVGPPAAPPVGPPAAPPVGPPAAPPVGPPAAPPVGPPAAPPVGPPAAPVSPVPGPAASPTETRRSRRSLTRILAGGLAVVLVVFAAVYTVTRLGEEQWAKVAVTLRGHTGPVNAAVYSHTGHLLATGGSDATVRLWNTDTNQPVGEPMRATAPVHALAFSADDQILASAGADGRVQLWSTATARYRPIDDGSGGLAPPAEPIRGLVFTEDGNRILAAGGEGTVQIWSVDTGRLTRSLFAGEAAGPTKAVVLDPSDQTVLAFAGGDRIVRSWNMNSPGTVPTTVDAADHGAVVSSLAFSTNGRLLATGGDDHRILLWDASNWLTLASPRVLKGHTGRVTSVAFDAPGGRLVSGGEDGTVRLWTVSTGAHLGAPLKPPGGGNVAAVTFNPGNGVAFATAGAGGDVLIWAISKP